MTKEDLYFNKEIIDGLLRFQLKKNNGEYGNHFLSDFLIVDKKMGGLYNPSAMTLMSLLNGLSILPIGRTSPEKRLKNAEKEFVNSELRFQAVPTPEKFKHICTSEYCVQDMKKGDFFNPSPANIAKLLNGNTEIIPLSYLG